MTQFREQLFVELAGGLASRSAHGWSGADLAERVEGLTQILCVRWGHEEEFVVRSYPGAETIAMPDKMHNHMRCKRCGAPLRKEGT